MSSNPPKLKFRRIFKTPYKLKNRRKKRTFDTGVKLTPRWHDLKYVKKQVLAWLSKSRFNVIHSGRRSGKTELHGKRKIIIKLLEGDPKYPDYRAFVGAPTRDQAKRIFWSDLKKMIPGEYILDKSETDLMIRLITLAELWVLGLDKPERLEGVPWNHGCIDEIGNTKPGTWEEHVRPALSDRKGSCDFIGVPEGRGEYYDLAQKGHRYMKRAKKENTIPRWATYHWLSAEVLDAEEIAEAKEDMDDLTYQQEYEGSFLFFTGRAYYNFSESLNVENCSQYYNPNEDLIFCFDFNVSPGTASVCQELQEYEGNIPIIGKTITAVINEVYVKRNSNTPLICEKLIEKYGNHQGRIFCYGDATGGAEGTAKVEGSDWTLIARDLRKHYGYNRIFIKVPKANPRERSRINAVNSRLKNVIGDIHLVIDGKNCPMMIKDFEGVRIDEGTQKIDKSTDKMLTHLTDGLGYYLVFEFPVDERRPAKVINV